MIQTLIIDNSGFDVAAMSQITEKEFIDTHKDTDSISFRKTPAETEKWLKDAYKAIKAAVAPVKEVKPKPIEQE